MILEETAQGWSKLRNLLNPIAPQIASLSVHPAMYGVKAILRFANDYGVEIFKHSDDDFVEMTILRFRRGDYDFAFGTGIPDLNLGYSDEDVLNLCKDVSNLR
jgi:hypothetical protein